MKIHIDSERVQQHKAVAFDDQRKGQSLPAVHPLQRAVDNTTVVQRTVKPGLEPGTNVKIKRSTSSEFHGAEAVIVEPGPASYEYKVRVDGKIVIASFDQLVNENESVGSVPVSPELDSLTKLDNDTIIQAIQDGIIKEYGRIAKKESPQLERGSVTIGGSFAAFLHARQARRAARTPRDIDIFLPQVIFHQIRHLDRRIIVCGLPLELHPHGPLSKPSMEESGSGILHVSTLLSQQLLKLRDYSDIFKRLVPKSKDCGIRTAADIVAQMSDGSDQLLRDIAADDVYDYNKVAAIWIKALKDAQQLVASGATLDVYKARK